jgi:hypothetical protein
VLESSFGLLLEQEEVTAWRDYTQVETLMGCLAEVALIEGDLTSVRELYSSGLRIAYRGVRRDMAYLILGLAQCLSNSSTSQERAALLLGAADAQNDLLGLPWENNRPQSTGGKKGKHS